MRPASGPDAAAAAAIASKKVPPKSRRKSSEDPDKNSSSQSKTSGRRKSSDGRDTSIRKDLSVISKSSSRTSSKTAAGDENASAFSSGSGGSSQKKALVRKGTATGASRTRSPTRDGIGEEALKKKQAAMSRRKSGETIASTQTQQHSSFTPDSNMWDTPSFFGSSAKVGEDPSSQSGFASPAFDGGVDDGAFDNALFSGFGEENVTANRKQSRKASAFADFDPAGTFPQAGAFGGGSPSAFDAAPRDKMDMNPLKDPPRRKVGKLSLVKKNSFSQHFACQPVKNPANGNIIFCTCRDGEMYIQEVDPSRNFVQVMASPILTPDLHRKVTAKYSRSAYGIDNVLKLCVGLHQSHGQPRVRIVAVVDLLVLDSKHILRAIAVWQWGYGSHSPVSLQFLLSPPSGTDYVSETVVCVFMPSVHCQSFSHTMRRHSLS
jgi:hypothetical protein